MTPEYLESFLPTKKNKKVEVDSEKQEEGDSSDNEAKDEKPTPQ